MNPADARPALRVLIVDDNRDAADTLALLLELYASADSDEESSRNRYDVRIAYSGTEGLRSAREFRPHCVVSDIRMPNMDGYTFARAIRREPALADVKLVALSAYSDPEHAREITEAGFDYRLTKGGDVHELLEVLGMIEEIKDLAERTRELAEKNVDLAGQTKDLLKEVKKDVRELKQDVAELKEDVKNLKDDGDKTPTN